MLTRSPLRQQQIRIFNRFLRRSPNLAAEAAERGFSHYQPGQKIAGKYLVHEKREGGLGQLFVVSEDDTHRFILKTPKPHADKFQFFNEARTWVSLGRHANIVPAFWTDYVAGMPCVAAEFISADAEGRTSLRDHIALTKLSLSQALRWTAQFCDAMKHSHERGLIAHRDIKPENLLISPDGDLQITDFGLSAASGPTNVDAGAVSGTPAYMAPEQWLGARQDFRTDAYSFGLVLYEICFGRLPWSAKTLAELRNECLTTEYFETPHGHPLNVVIPLITRRDRDPELSPSVLRELSSIAAKTIGIKLPAPANAIHQEREDLLAEASLSLVGDEERALVAARQLTRRWPEFAPGWTQLGRLLYSSGQLREAGLASQRAADLDPTRSAPWNNLGLIFNRAGHYQQAISLFQRALDCDPGNTGAMINMAAPLIQLKRCPEAIKNLERAVQLSPDKLAGWINLGSALSVSGETQRATDSFRRALACVGDQERPAVVAQIRQLMPRFAP